MNISLSYSEFLQDNYVLQSSTDRTSNQGLKIRDDKNCQIMSKIYQPFLPSKLANNGFKCIKLVANGQVISKENFDFIVLPKI